MNLFSTEYFSIASSPPISRSRKASANLQDNFTEEIGWQELVDGAANVYDALPAEEKVRAGILAANYGKAGAVNLYGANPDCLKLSVWLIPTGCAAIRTRRPTL